MRIGWFSALSLTLWTIASLAAAQPPPTPAALRPLSKDDAAIYAEAFRAAHAGDFDAIKDISNQVDDECLIARLDYIRLMHPAYSATYGELKAWLKKHHDQPGAERVYTLARKKAPAKTDLDDPDADPSAVVNPDPTLPNWARGPGAAPDLTGLKAPTVKVDPRLQQAKEAYYGGDTEEGYRLATLAGERWVAGLAAFRLKKYEVAEARLTALANDATQSEWVRSAAAFWAARAAVASGAPERAPTLLQIAAKTPYTFYGLIAERQLGLDPAITPAGFDMGELREEAAEVGPSVAASTSALAKLVRGDKRAHRAAALAQIGLKGEAGQELRTALLNAGSPDARRQWVALGVALGVPLTASGDLTRGGKSRFDLTQFPVPDLQPTGGFTLDKALVYAIVRQESGFRADASSNASAYGLMQLTPATAARVVGDDKLAKDPSPLIDPAFNLRVGQDYVTTLLGIVQGDVLRAVAAYNAGPGTIIKTAKRLDPDADSLLVFESMPGGQTREFVQRVVSNYWIYRQIFGQDCPSLAALASGARSVGVDP
jgi:soluble lytic murein transglycosylase-like protein